jgi:hypothetical protein
MTLSLPVAGPLCHFLATRFMTGRAFNFLHLTMFPPSQFIYGSAVEIRFFLDSVAMLLPTIHLRAPTRKAIDPRVAERQGGKQFERIDQQDCVCLASYVFCGSCAYGNIASEAGVERFAVVL